jgi:hypothetical protein
MSNLQLPAGELAAQYFPDGSPKILKKWSRADQNVQELAANLASRVDSTNATSALGENQEIYDARPRPRLRGRQINARAHAADDSSKNHSSLNLVLASTLVSS